MNCTQVEKLLPLHAGNDLPTEQAVLVSTHLTHCASCQSLVAEFAASRDWLGAFSTPAFDEAVFDEMRMVVRQQIAQAEAQPGLLTLLTTWWRPRYAVAIAILLLAGLSFYAYRQQRAAIKEAPLARNQQQSERTPVPPTRVSDKSKIMVAAQRPLRRRSARQSTIAITRRATSAPLQPVSIMTNNAEVRLPSLDEQLALREMARMEFQTADPNIRIIWLTAPEQAVSASQKSQ
jgi:hypothetical protein